MRAACRAAAVGATPPTKSGSATGTAASRMAAAAPLASGPFSPQVSELRRGAVGRAWASGAVGVPVAADARPGRRDRALNVPLGALNHIEASIVYNAPNH